MIGKKINQLATELAPESTDLTIIGDPTTGVSKKITLAQLGAIFSGAVSFYNDLASFPVSGDINVIYCAKDTQKLYLWSGSAYTEVFPSQALLDTYQLRSEKGNANGYASLDSGGKVPISQLPSSIMEYKGTWNAATNTPTLANGTGDTGDVYICNVAGTVNFGAGPITFAVGDYVIYSGTIWQRSSGAVGTVTSVAASITGDSVTISGSPVTTSGTLAFAFNGTTAQYIRGNGTLETFPSLTGFVPYTGATANVDLGTHTLLAAKGIFSSSGSGDTVGITHSSGSGIALNITKGGNGEGLYINKTSGSGNAATIIGTLNATTLVKSGGTSSQFLKADGSVDSTAYGTGSVTSVGALTIGTSGTDLSSTVANGTTTPVITLNVPTASATNRGALSSTDWTTFNNKQNALTNPITGTGTNNYIPKFTTTGSTIGNSTLQEVSGNLGLGVTPNTWAGTGTKAFQFQNGTLSASNSYGLSLAWNAYYDGADRYVTSGVAGRYLIEGNAHVWQTAPSGTAGNAISFTPAMTLDASGNLVVGDTTTSGRLRVVGNGAANGLTIKSSGNVGTYPFRVTWSGGTDGSWFCVNDSGNVGIGTSSPNHLLSLSASASNGTVIGFYNTFNDARNRNWGIATNQVAFGDFHIMQSNAKDGNPISAGTSRLTIASTGAASFSSSVIAYGPANDWGLSIWGSTTTGQSYGGIVRGGTNSSDVAFKVNNAANTIPYFNIRGDGNVGIGLTNPQTQLQLNGTLTFSEAGFDTVRLNQIASQHSDGSSPNNFIRFLVSNGSGTTAERMRINGEGALQVTSTIQTGAPTGGTAQAWRLGAIETGTCVPSPGGGFTSWFTGTVVQISVNGTTYRIPVVNSNYC
jgi:hypothetical protein